MQFTRLACLQFTPPLSGTWSSWKIRIGAVDLATMRATNPSPPSRTSRILVQATILIPFPAIDASGFLSIPLEQRTECENALQIAADLIAISSRSSRVVLSPFPCWALITDDPQERERLNLTKGVCSVSAMQSGFQSPIPFEEALIHSLTDRLLGVAILAEAFSHNTSAGKYRDLVRFFEHAFSISFVAQKKKLSDFLLPAMGYTRAEIKLWRDLRDPMIHADGMKTTGLAFDRDVRRITQRMEQAALDVLFNKTEWSSRSVSRRSVWIPEAMTTAESGRGVIRQNSKQQSITFQILDDFGVFASDMEAVLKDLPENWWSRSSRADNAEGLRVG